MIWTRAMHCDHKPSELLIFIPRCWNIILYIQNYFRITQFQLQHLKRRWYEGRTLKKIDWKKLHVLQLQCLASSIGLLTQLWCMGNKMPQLHWKSGVNVYVCTCASLSLHLWWRPEENKYFILKNAISLFLEHRYWSLLIAGLQRGARTVELR